MQGAPPRRMRVRAAAKGDWTRVGTGSKIYVPLDRRFFISLKMEAVMFRRRMTLATLLAVGLAVAGCAPANVEEEIALLNERVDTLEKQIQSLQAGGPPGAELEQEARNALAAVTQLVSAGRIDDAKAQLRSIGSKYASTRLGRNLQTLARELAVVGLDSPSSWGIEKWFQGQDAVDLDGDGTVVVIFWESWCPHCRKEVPKLQAMYDRFRHRGLQVIGLTKINRSATEQSVKDIVAQNNVSYPIAKEDGTATKYFAVSGIPAAAVVKGGKVVWRGHPARITDAMLSGWLTT
jgi:thiol-disulfide isomerase/thioredoxin